MAPLVDSLYVVALLTSAAATSVYSRPLDLPEPFNSGDAGGERNESPTISD